MDKKELIWGTMALAVLIGLLWYGGQASVPEERKATVTPEAAQYFNEEVNRVSIERGAHPIEGFVPFMLMDVFPGITPSDFEEVEAVQGHYHTIEGEAVFESEVAQEEQHTAGAAINEKGMGTLLENIATRLNMSAKTKADVDSIFQKILVRETAEISGDGPSKPVTSNQDSDNPDEGYVCTMDAKLCPDGSGVGRSGPRCEFAKCPGETEEGFRTCPDEWVINKMPGIVGQNDTPREYFIIDGTRWEIDGFDMNWVRNNCSVEREEAY